MTRSASLFDHLVERAASALAADPLIPPQSRQAYQQHVAHVLRAQIAAVVGGERVYAPKIAADERAAARERIVGALARGESVGAIARREGVTDRWVRRLRGTLRGTLRP